MRFALGGFLLILWLVGTQEASAGQLVVIHSTEPGLTPGMLVDGSKPLALAAGNRITVVGEDGKVTTLTGPYSGVVGVGGRDSREGSLTAALARLLASMRARSPSVGITRAPPSASATLARPIWAIAVRRSGNHCVRAGAAPELWRAKSLKAVTLVIEMLPDGGSVSVPWPAGAGRLAWPKGVRLVDGGQYLAKVSEQLSASQLLIRIVPSDLPTDAHRVAWMAEQGCTAQAEALLADLY